jgi:PPOX class probable F420-dependent enzyme
MSDFTYTMQGDGESPTSIAGLPHIAGQLDEELVGWFTTVSPSGQPQSSAVWFLRDGDSLLMYSSDKATRLANIDENPRVAFNLRADARGDVIVTLEGVAGRDPAASPPGEHPRCSVRSVSSRGHCER